ELVMEAGLGLPRRALQQVKRIAVTDHHVRDDLLVLRRDLGGRAVDEEMPFVDRVEHLVRPLAHEAALDEEGRDVLARHDHDLLAHRNASTTASCSSPFVESPLPPS